LTKAASLSPQCRDCAADMPGARVDRARCDNCRTKHKRKMANAWAESNPQLSANRSRAWRLAHPVEMRAHGRAWRERNPESSRMRARLARNFARARGAGAITSAEWSALCAEYSDRCAYCLGPGPLTMDHFIPLISGGSNSVSNIVPACRSCNSGKQGHPFLLWFARKNGRLNRLPRSRAVS
jgi:5-methylcytosine-specific restriction endonuclease McrA